MRFSQYLAEAPLPDDWDKGLFNDRVPFKRRVEYAKDRARRLGAGSSRIAFVIPFEGRDTVLKVAKNRKGMAQNEEEASVLNDWYLAKIGIFIPMIDHDESSSQPTWIHTELAGKVTDADFVRECGGTLAQLMQYLRYEQNRIGSKHALRRVHKPEMINEESELVQGMVDYIGSYDPNLGDYDGLRNWGMYNGSPVIIDAGYSDEVQKLYFR